ncbi:MAG: hypothetical protein M3309_13990 [Actinomycetota bacterium]|nr:hypothetical protein [Actinomycetota bacterium]
MADRLAQELLPRRHRPLKVLLALGFQVQADLFEQLLVIVVSVALVGIMIELSGKSNSDSLDIVTSASNPDATKRTPPALRLR